MWDTQEEEEKLAKKNTTTFGQVKSGFELILFV